MSPLGSTAKYVLAPQFLDEIRANGVDLYLHVQGVDTTTPAGRALFQMLGVFAEFERSIIQERIHAGLARARTKGVRLGRPPVVERLAERQIIAARARRSDTWPSIGPLSQFQSNSIRTPMRMTATAASAPKICLRRLLTDRVRSSEPTPKRADGSGQQASRRLVF